MKLVDAKLGQKVRLPKWGPGAFWRWDDDERLRAEDGTLLYVHREYFTRDDWEPVESDADKIARLETNVAYFKSELGTANVTCAALRAELDATKEKLCASEKDLAAAEGDSRAARANAMRLLAERDIALADLEVAKAKHARACQCAYCRTQV